MDKKLKIAIILIIALFALFFGLAFFTDNSPKSLSTNLNAEQKTINNDGFNNSKSNIIPEIINKPTYKIFFENSGSMNGYVRGNTRLKDGLFQLIGNLKNHQLTVEDPRLFYLNTIAIPRNETIEQFIYGLSRESFISAGGNLSQTDMAGIFQLVLDNTDLGDVSIMISDCILSPGRNVSAAQFLNRHRVLVSNTFAEKLRQYEFNTLILQASTEYHGVYWDQNNQTTQISGIDRPYFIWIFGKDQNIREFRNSLNRSTIITKDITHSHYFFLWDETQLNYQILPNPKIGSFRLTPSTPRNTIENARTNTTGPLNGVFEFSIGINFSNLPLDGSYYTNPDNYQVNSNYSLRITPTESQNYTHLLRLRTNNLKQETLVIKLLNNIPQWVEKVNLYDDTNILLTDQIDGTFGLKYLFLGAHEGYLTHDRYGDSFLNLEIQINL